MASNDGSPRSLGWRIGASVALFVAAGALLGASHDRIRGLERQVESLGISARSEEAQRRSLIQGVDADLATLRTELADLRLGLHEAIEAAQDDSALRARLEETHAELATLHTELEQHAGTIEALREDVTVVASEELPALIAEREERLEQRYESMRDLIDSTRQVAEASMAEVDSFKRLAAERRDLGEMWRDLVGPVVQLAGESSVGSGVLLESEVTETGYRTLVLTAWHVVRDILEDAGGDDELIPVAIYREDGSIQQEFADLVCRNVDLDAAVLVLRSDARFENGARLAPREQLDEVTIFERIYAVGCPLGNDPIPTAGEIATCRHVIDGSQYWMINAPTYIGNSGGGIFASDGHELLGIFSKIYTHGSLRPTIVPHMGLVTPLNRIYDWLVAEGYATEEGPETGLRIASARR